MFVFKERTSPLKKDINVIKGGPHFEVEIEKTMHLKNIYKHVHDWLADNNYYDAETGKGDKFEPLYYEIKKADGLMFHHIWWRCLKKPEGFSNDEVFRYFLKINFQTLAMSKKEIMIDGKKFKTYSGDLIVRIKAWFQVDPYDKWSKHPILKHFESILINRWLKSRIEEHKDTFYAEVIELQRLFKQYMGRKVEVDTRKQFFNEETGI
jgi:hypothetical protein